MKRNKLLKHLRTQGCELLREGAKHSWWHNPALKKISAIPRHTEIKDILAKNICKDLGVDLINNRHLIQIELTCLPISAYSRAVSNRQVRLNLLFKKPDMDYIDSFSDYYEDWLKGEGWQVPDFRW